MVIAAAQNRIKRTKYGSFTSPNMADPFSPTLHL
jgi:hypothetical protein